MRPTVLAVTGDLMTSAPIEKACWLSGASCRVIAPAAVNHLEEQSLCRLVLIDLATVEDVRSLVEAIQAKVAADVPLVAFGPHVHADLLAEAELAGCSQVLSRGQFHRDTKQIVELAVKESE